MFIFTMPHQGDQENTHQTCRDFRHTLISVEDSGELTPLLGVNDEDEYYFSPMDMVFAAFLTIIVAVSVLSGLYLIIEENDWGAFEPHTDGVLATKTTTS